MSTGISRPTRLVARIGLLPLIAVASGACVALLHTFGPLSVPYTWLRPLQILSDVVARRNAFAIVFAGFVFGWLARPAAQKPSLRSLWTEASSRERVRVVLAALLGALADFLYFDVHSPADHLATAIVCALLVHPAMWRSGTARQRSHTLLELGITLLAFTLVSYAFTVIKAHLFLVSVPNDAMIVEWERGLFGEPLHAVIADWAATQRDFVTFCDKIYYYLFDHMAVVSAFLSGLNQPKVRQQYVSSLCICYLIGGVSYYALPSMGPAFFDPSHFVYVRNWHLDTLMFQGLLFQSTSAAVNGSLPELNTYAFLAAMPSLHMAHEFVMLWYSWRSPILARSPPSSPGSPTARSSFWAGTTPATCSEDSCWPC